MNTKDLVKFTDEVFNLMLEDQLTNDQWVQIMLIAPNDLNKAKELLTKELTKSKA